MIIQKLSKRSFPFATGSWVPPLTALVPLALRGLSRSCRAPAATRQRVEMVERCAVPSLMAFRSATHRMTFLRAGTWTWFSVEKKAKPKSMVMISVAELSPFCTVSPASSETMGLPGPCVLRACWTHCRQLCHQVSKEENNILLLKKKEGLYYSQSSVWRYILISLSPLRLWPLLVILL